MLGQRFVTLEGLAVLLPELEQVSPNVLRRVEIEGKT